MSQALGILGPVDPMQTLAERQHGLVGHEQALAYGMTRGQIDTRLRSRRWELAARGCTGFPVSVPTWEQRLLAAVLCAGDGAAASRRSAAALWRIPGFRPGPIEVTQSRGASVRNPRPGLHDSRFLPAHQVRTVRAIPATCPERTLLDLCGCVHRLRAERAWTTASPWVPRPSEGCG
jgi:hypothetical protein